MKKMIALAAAFSVAMALEAVQAQFSYQCVLQDTNGSPLTGNKTVEVRLYEVATGGIVLWGRRYNVQLDSSGLFNAEVSDTVGTQIVDSSLDAVLANRESIYIGLTVSGTSGEIKPRQKLLSVPFAAVAANVSQANGSFTVTGKLTADSAGFAGDLSAKTMNVTGAASVGSLTAKGNTTVSGNLKVSGTISGFGTVPIESIIMWSGAVNEIPSGWALCDGRTVNGHTTPNLCKRFIVGAGGDGYSVGATGGTNEVKLTIEQMPSHTHTYSFKGADIDGDWKKSNFFYCQHNQYDLPNTKETDSAGGDQAHENRPPYYALCFIMRVR